MKSIAIIGKPNTGKSLLFNRLTGMSQKVTNFPGITVQVKEGHRGEMSFFDFPGVYSLTSLTQDEAVAISKFEESLKENKIHKILCTLDAAQLPASLRLGLEVRDRAAQAKVPIVFALNMIDELPSPEAINVQGLQKALGCPVVSISAKTGQGFNQLLKILEENVPPPMEIENLAFYEQSVELNERYGLGRQKHKVSGWDRIFLSPIMGVFSFFLIMTILFQAIFTFAVPFMDGIEFLVASLAQLTVENLSDGVLKDFLVDALFGGLGSFLVFIPQIFFLTFIIGILEDSGYLARAAMLCHRPLRFFGLSGKSFIPMLTGHACAIPAIFATRMIDSPRRRFLTILILPLMGCSARLPVYAFLIAAIIPQTTYWGGLIGLQGIALFSMYLFSILLSLVVSWTLSRGQYLKKEDIPFILELPRYRIPHWKPLFFRAFHSVWQFLARAGLVIFVVTVVVWILGYFPNQKLETSYLATMGHWIQPLLTPLGLDWKYGVAILASFLAREVFVGTLGTLFEIENAEDNFVGLVENVQQSGLSFGAGLGLLVFYAIALQCASTFALLRVELASLKSATALLVSYGLLAYFLAWITFSVLA